MNIHVRWMIHAYLDEVLEIELASFREPWTLAEIAQRFSAIKCVAQVAEFDRRVVAYMLYELGTCSVELGTICVHPSARRKGVGRTLIEVLKTKLGSDRAYKTNRIRLVVSERNLQAQQFFRSQGFLSTQLMRNYYGSESPGVAAIRMQYERGSKSKWSMSNRLTKVGRDE